MESVETTSVATSDPDLEDPALVEGLPGIGFVGTFAARHIVDELDGRPVRRVYSEHFPPLMSVEDDGTIVRPSLTVHAVEAERDLLVLTGPLQADDPVGQHRLSSEVLDIASGFGATEVVSLGGAATGEPVEEPTIMGVVGEETGDLGARLEAAGVSVRDGDVPETISGVSGLLLGLGDQRGFDVAGILGTTGGYRADPNSARVVLETLQETLGFSVDLSAFDYRPEGMIENVDKLAKIQQQPQQQSDGDDLRYFG